MTIDIFPDNNTSIQLNESYVKDKNYVYFIKRGKVYDDFEIEEIKSHLDDNYDNEAYKRLLFSEDSSWAYYDSVDIWEMKQQWVEWNKVEKEIEAIGRLQDTTYLVVEWADIETFEALSNEYGKDKNTLYYQNLPSDKLILSTAYIYNPIHPISNSYYQLKDAIFQQIENPESLQIVGHYNTHSVLMKDQYYIYLYFLDEETWYAEKIKKIFHFTKPNNDTLETYNYNTDDCYLKWNSIVYNYYQEDWCDYFSIVEWVDIETFNGYRDKFYRYEYWKIAKKDLSIEEIPF